MKGKKITRKGTKDNPAYLIEQEDGTNVLKLKSELN
ncbi:MAG: HVA1 family protein [Waterburya sp.]